MTNRVEIIAHRPQYTGVPVPLVVDLTEFGIVFIPYGQQAFRERTVCVQYKLACGFVSFFSYRSRNGRGFVTIGPRDRHGVTVTTVPLEGVAQGKHIDGEDVRRLAGRPCAFQIL